MSTKTAIFKNVRDKGKYFAIENQKNADFLKFRQQKKPSRCWTENLFYITPHFRSLAIFANFNRHPSANASAC